MTFRGDRRPFCASLKDAMPVPKIIAAVGVNILVPLLGVIVFILLCRRMKRTHIQSPPFLYYFILFATYGGWLMVLLTALFWEWSGMASFGMLYLLLVAPVLTGVMFWKLRSKRTLSTFHQCAFLLSGAYTCFVIVAVPLWLRYPGVGR